MKNSNAELTSFEKIIAAVAGIMLGLCLITQWESTQNNTELLTATKIDVDTVEIKTHPVAYEYNGEETTEYRYHSTYYDVTYEYWYDDKMYHYKVRTYNTPEDTVELYVNPNNPSDAVERDSKVSVGELIRK